MILSQFLSPSLPLCSVPIAISKVNDTKMVTERGADREEKN